MHNEFININNAILIVIDVQERLLPVIHEGERILHNINTLIQGAEILHLETVITEQYPKGLGKTVTSLKSNEHIAIYEKDTFSCMLQSELLQQLIKTDKKDLILCGIESHICVLKTALDALNTGFRVHVVADAVSSRTSENKSLALERIRQSGGYIVSVEMILFMLMERAGTDTFKAISKLIK
ncbi:MAG TPA: hydrolase [Saprospiraceae bacterium]|nr:hydrolase [Saprospiraceae bacterium]HRO09703.1 hydrolase [Saprospiraceae bacterium]HRP43021.1 hydrolase [Saprospiraceae bacterium]